MQAAKSRAAPDTVLPQLVGLLHSLPASITTFSLYPRPVLAPRQALRGAGAGADPTFASWDFDSQATAASAAVAATTNTTSAVDPFAAFADVMGSGPAVQQAPSDGVTPAAHAALSTNTGSVVRELVTLGALATASGSVDVVVVRRGIINPFGLEVACSLSVHKDAVRGVRWLGTSPRFASFSSEKAGHGGFRNSLAITDIRSRRRYAINFMH